MVKKCIFISIVALMSAYSTCTQEKRTASYVTLCKTCPTCPTCTKSFLNHCRKKELMATEHQESLKQQHGPVTNACPVQSKQATTNSQLLSTETNGISH